MNVRYAIVGIFKAESLFDLQLKLNETLTYI